MSWWKFIDRAEDEDEEEDDPEIEEELWYTSDSPWISKYDRMPKMWERVFVVVANGTVYESMYIGDKPDDWNFGSQDILYWMPEPDTKGLAGIISDH